MACRTCLSNMTCIGGPRHRSCPAMESERDLPEGRETVRRPAATVARRRLPRGDSAACPARAGSRRSQSEERRNAPSAHLPVLLLLTILRPLHSISALSSLSSLAPSSFPCACCRPESPHVSRLCTCPCPCTCVSFPLLSATISMSVPGTDNS